MRRIPAVVRAGLPVPSPWARCGPHLLSPQAVRGGGLLCGFRALSCLPEPLPGRTGPAVVQLGGGQPRMESPVRTIPPRSLWPAQCGVCDPPPRPTQA